MPHLPLFGIVELLLLRGLEELLQADQTILIGVHLSAREGEAESAAEPSRGGRKEEAETCVLHDVLPHPQPLLLHLHHVVLLVLRVVEFLQLQQETGADVRSCSPPEGRLPTPI